MKRLFLLLLLSLGLTSISYALTDSQRNALSGNSSFNETADRLQAAKLGSTAAEEAPAEEAPVEAVAEEAPAEAPVEETPAEEKDAK